MRTGLAAALVGSCFFGFLALAEADADESGDPMAARGGDNPGGPADLAGLTRSEDLLLELTPSLGRLAEEVMNLALFEIPPGSETDSLFAPMVRFQLAEADPKEVKAGAISEKEAAEGYSIPGVVIGRREWSTAGDGSRERDPDGGVVAEWSRLQADAAYFEHAKFYFVRGSLVAGSDGTEESFVVEAGFDAQVRMQSGDWRAVHAEQELVWRRAAGGEGGEGRTRSVESEGASSSRWKIVEWRQGPIVFSEAPSLFFREVLGEALPRSEDYRRARHSQHERHIVDLFTKDAFHVAKQVYADHLDLDSTYQHPGLSVVDHDRDGWDDLYVMGRWGRNQLLRNRGDGTFEDVAGSVGLDIDGLCNGAVFADFDNDGDTDAFIARSLERSLYLRNEDGRYVDRSREAFGALPLPFLASSVSAVDYNGDGLLDLYVSLYGPTHTGQPIADWARTFFPPQLADELVRRSGESHRYIHLVGPPNLLLANRGGGRFEVAPEAGDLAEWHNTYQSTWADFDDDGDPDVHVCNDFGPDHLYRNDEGPMPGLRRFTEVSRQMAGDAMQGFGMGATWGDFDRDGRLDLYVSNMFSKAGRRITAAIPGLDPRIPYSAEGNLLFRNRGDRFEQVAGLKPPAMMVAKVGWAYGAQFVDIDNDGWLDIHSASGFYTAPDEIATERDL